jgi:hypothetical protein
LLLLIFRNPNIAKAHMPIAPTTPPKTINIICQFDITSFESQITAYVTAQMIAKINNLINQ